MKSWHDRFLTLRAVLSFLILPGSFAGLLPWLVVCADPWRSRARAAPVWTVMGGTLAALGLVLLAWCVRDFLVVGHGTLAPWDPPRRLVVVGLYRVTRNPMYVAILILLAGWSLATLSPLLVCYALLLALAFHLRVILYEERRLAEQFPTDWEAYRSHVPRWIGRRRRTHAG